MDSLLTNSFSKMCSDPEFRKNGALTPNFLTTNFGNKKGSPQAAFLSIA